MRLVEIENFSKGTTATYAAEQLVDPNNYNATFLFGPTSTGLLDAVTKVTEPNKKILMSSRSNHPNSWNGTFKYTFGMLWKWPARNVFRDTFKLYAEKGAKKIGVICDPYVYNTANNNYCMNVMDLAAEVAPYGMTVNISISVFSGNDTTYNELREAVKIMSQSDIDVLIVSTGIGMSYPPVLAFTQRPTSYLKDIIYFMKDLKVFYPIFT